MKYRISLKAQADRYYELILEKINEICQKPDVGKKYDGIRKGYWGINIKSHIIFYKIQDHNLIEVIRILHNRMDIENRLAE